MTAKKKATAKKTKKQIKKKTTAKKNVKKVVKKSLPKKTTKKSSSKKITKKTNKKIVKKKVTKPSSKKVAKKTAKKTIKKIPVKKPIAKKKVTTKKKISPVKKVEQKKEPAAISMTEQQLLTPSTIDTTKKQKKKNNILRDVFYIVILAFAVISYLYFSRNKKVEKKESTDRKVEEKSVVDNIVETTEEPKVIETKAKKETKKEEDIKVPEIESISIYFTKSSGWVSHSQKPKLNKVVNYLKENSERKIVIIGHACVIGGNNLNYHLSRFRARNVAKYLLKNGIEESRIITKAEGQLQPVNANSTEEQRIENRRVQFNIK